MGFFYPLEVTGCSVRWLVLQRFAKQLGTVRSRLSSIDYKKKKNCYSIPLLKNLIFLDSTATVFCNTSCLAGGCHRTDKM